MCTGRVMSRNVNGDTGSRWIAFIWAPQIKRMQWMMRLTIISMVAGMAPPSTDEESTISFSRSVLGIARRTFAFKPRRPWRERSDVHTGTTGRTNQLIITSVFRMGALQLLELFRDYTTWPSSLDGVNWSCGVTTASRAHRNYYYTSSLVVYFAHAKYIATIGLKHV